MSIQALKTVAVKLTTKVDTKGLDKAEKKSKRLIGTMKKLGVALATAFSVKKAVDVFKATLSTADALAKQARAAKISVAALEEMRFVYDHLGVAPEIALKAAGKFFTYLGDKAKPTEKALRKLHLTFKDFGGLNRAQALEKLLLTTAKSGLSAAEQLAILKNTIGDDAALQLEKALRQGPAAFEKAKNDFIQAGGAAFAGMAAMGEESQDQFANIAQTLAHVKVAFTQAFLGNNPEEARKRGKVIGDAFLKIAENMDMILSIAGVLFGLLSLGSVIGPLGKVASALKIVWGWGSKIVAVLGVLGEIIAGVTAPVWGWVAAIAAVVAGVVLLWKNWDIVSEKLEQAWNWIKKIASGAMGKVLKFFGSGDDGTVSAPATTFNSPKYFPPSVRAKYGDTRTTNNNNHMTVNVDARGQNPAQTVDQIEKMQRRQNRAAYAGS